MSYVTCHTRGNTSGQGKAKIWLCVHPDECETYLGPISENIYNVNYRDWAVWYDNEPTEDCDEDLLKKLSRIELFVVPVTWKLLNEPNRAMDVEIPFAIQHHIPVLPLMQASGLVDRFNERFHNLQYIDAADVDFAAKLKNYLTRILVEGEQIDEIKRNFAKHIFFAQS